MKSVVRAPQIHNHGTKLG